MGLPLCGLLPRHFIESCFGHIPISLNYFYNESDHVSMKLGMSPAGRMEIVMKSLKTAGIVGLLAVSFALAAPQTKASTEPVRERQGVTTALSGNASAVTYWVNEPDGWHVVTTVDTVTSQFDGSRDHAVVRFSSVLQPGQSQLISVPLAIGEQQRALRIHRLNDQIEVEFVPIT
jgi:hypothetical protein